MSSMDRVRVLDDEDDDSSIMSFMDEPGRYSRRRSLKLPKPLGRDATLKVDGKVPDVLHVIEYLNFSNAVIATRQSVTAFKKIPEYSDLTCPGDTGEDTDGASPGDLDIEKPVIEILTQISSRRYDPRSRYGPPPPPPRPAPNSSDRPITAAFDPNDHRYDGYSSDTDQPEFEVGISEPVEPVMVVHSAHLKNALKAVVAYYPYFRLTEGVLTIKPPYRVLYHHRNQLAKYRDNQPAAHSPEYVVTTAHHIDVLLRFLDESIGREIRQEQERHALKTPVATYNYFWLLLKPGEIIYAKRYDIWTPYVISSVIGGGQHGHQQTDKYTVRCWLLESNGTKVNRFMEAFTVAPWLGEQAITGLSVVPAVFWKEDLGAQGGLPMRQKQIALGRLYWELLKQPTYMAYDGLLVNSFSGNRTASGPTGFMCGRVICDASGFDKYYNRAPEMMGHPRRIFPHNRRVACPGPGSPHKDHLPKTLPRCGCAICDKNRPAITQNSPYVGFEDLLPGTDTPPETDLFYLVLSNTIPGFILGDRRWGHLNIGNLSPVKTDKEAFKYLVLDDEIKLTVKALIGKFAAGLDGQITPWGNDFVKNKGEGRIFLLHGTPGVGKTCTAECIAELTNRPLIALTSGDLSVDADRVEESLSYFLELGKRYGALVLLDEADVYLERRRSKDIARNGLVSVFLRALEYYRGVLFLTTNRVQSFDSAFLSRIHVALHYKNLRDEDRERIWANNFERLDRDSAGKVHVSVAAREFVWGSREVRALKWNGREIRNAMQTALALAESDAQEEGSERATIGEKHIRAVVKLSKSFKDFVKAAMPLEGTDYVDEDSFSAE